MSSTKEDLDSDTENKPQLNRVTRTPDNGTKGMSRRMGINSRATAITRSRYTRIAPIYDKMEILAEQLYHPWRQKLWTNVAALLPKDGTFLEVGVGTGKNIPYWPKKAQITAIDVTPAMLQRARTRVVKLGVKVDLKVRDIQDLTFSDNQFDLAAATFVFCSVPDPIVGLKELVRVVRSGGYVILLEHVRAIQPILGTLMDTFNPAIVRMIGVNINRDTVANVQDSGLIVTKVYDLDRVGIYKLIIAQVQKDQKNM